MNYDDISIDTGIVLSCVTSTVDYDCPFPLGSASRAAPLILSWGGVNVFGGGGVSTLKTLKFEKDGGCMTPPTSHGGAAPSQLHLIIYVGCILYSSFDQTVLHHNGPLTTSSESQLDDLLCVVK